MYFIIEQGNFVKKQHGEVVIFRYKIEQVTPSQNRKVLYHSNDLDQFAKEKLEGNEMGLASFNAARRKAAEEAAKQKAETKPVKEEPKATPAPKKKSTKSKAKK